MSSVKDSFKNHIQNNQKIVLSGKFGMGKTHFLRDLFDENEEFGVCHLFPVNYHISSNEDIIDLLKYDIISWLHDSEVFTFDNTNNKEVVESILNYSGKSFLTFAKKMGKSFLPIIAKIILKQVGIGEEDFRLISQGILEGKDLIDNTIDGIKTELEKIQKDNVEAKEIQDKIGKLKTNLNGQDFLSSFIHTKLYKNYIKTNKKSVLIIDDLDRLDPEHIFRVLNVISAFNDIHTGINMFGFDKIVIVLDIKNIKSI